MKELDWMYFFVTKEEFHEKIKYAENLLEKCGAKFVGVSSQKGLQIQTDGTSASETIEQRVYKLGSDYIRVDRVFFPQKPFIVLEFSDMFDGPYEDADPFPYDLPEDEFEYEVRFSLGMGNENQ